MFHFRVKFMKVNKIFIIGEKSDLCVIGCSKQASKLKHPLWVAPYIEYDLRLHTIIKKKILDADAYVNSLIVERSSRAKITAERIQFSFLNYLLAGR